MKQQVAGVIHLAVWAVAVAIAPVAGAAPGSGVVEGDIALPPAGVQEPAATHIGYIPRIKNPITELRPFDPRPECFVFLDGGPVADDAMRPQTGAQLKVGVAAFSPPLLPVVAGTEVSLKNVSRATHPL